MASLFRQIIQQNPPIKVLNMGAFSSGEDRENIGEIILEALMSSNFNTITNLNLFENRSWFKHPDTSEERSGNLALVADLIIKHADLQHINLGGNFFSSNATQAVLERIAGNPSTSTKL